MANLDSLIKKRTNTDVTYEPSASVYNQEYTIDQVKGKRIKCARCGGVCIDGNTEVPHTWDCVETAFGKYCPDCYKEILYDETDWYEVEVDDFVACCGTPGYLSDQLENNEESFNLNWLKRIITSWNRAKKDSRFIYTEREVKAMEDTFIDFSLETDYEIDRAVFESNNVANKIIHESKSFYRDFKLYENLWK